MTKLPWPQKGGTKQNVRVNPKHVCVLSAAKMCQN